jgi:hypothetical protein
MSRSVLLVFTNATDGDDAEFNRWYGDVHLAEVLEVPGIVAAERFALADAQLTPGDHEHRYLAIYEIEGDPAEAAAGLLKAEMNMSETLHPQIQTALYTQLGPRQTEKAR